MGTNLVQLLRGLNTCHSRHGLIQYDHVKPVRVSGEFTAGLHTVLHQSYIEPPVSEQILHELPHRSLIIGQQDSSMQKDLFLQIRGFCG